MSRHLAFEVANHSVTVIQLSEGEVVRSWTTELSGRTLSDRRYEFESFLKINSIDEKEYDNVTVSVVSKRSTLVPTTVFGDTNAKDVYRLCFGNTSEGLDIDYNRIPEHGVVNIFDVQDWIKSFFVIRFPLVVIQHGGSHLIRAALEKNAFKTKVSIHLFEDHFLMTITKHDKLEFYAYFDYNAPEDVIYHTLFVLQQKELTGESGTIVLTTGTGFDQESIAPILEHFSRVKDLDTFRTEVVHDLHAKSQLLCV